MTHQVTAILIVFCSAFFAASDVIAQSATMPESNVLYDRIFLPELNAVCGAGKKSSQGCKAIREREIVDSSVLPWRAIGRINFASIQVRSYCTGTLLSERIVLTAAHCLYNFSRKAWIPAGSVRFVAGYQRGAGEAVSEVARYVLDPVQDTYSRDFRGNPSQDWALLVLKDPIGSSTGFLPTQSTQMREAKGANMILAGYAGLREHVLAVASDCGTPKFGLDPKVFLLKCSAMGGDSGAPILVVENGTARVVGVLSRVFLSASEHLSVGIPVSTFEHVLSSELQK